MTTALDIITRALRSIGALGANETADAGMASDGLDALNDLLAAWSIEKLMVYQAVQESFTLSPGVATYTIGPSGAFDTTRPVAVESAFIRSGDVDYPVQIIMREQYNEIGTKSLRSDIPYALYVDPGYPLDTLKFYGTPGSAASIYLTSRKELAALASLATSVSLPPGYERALRLCLAVEMMPEYGTENALVIQQASNAKAWIKRANYRPRVMGMPAGIPLQGRYDIRRGD